MTLVSSANLFKNNIEKTTDGKPHFVTLDGMRGIAALMVVIMHWVSNWGNRYFSTSVLAVDFFFILSGFVVAYSYENRLKSGMDIMLFIKSRIIRLYPMIFLGATVWLIRYIIKSILLEQHDFKSYFLDYFLTLLLIPNSLLGSIDIFNLNAPLWSLFFEFFAYLCFAIFLFRLKNHIIGIIVIIGFCFFTIWVKNNFGFGFHADEHPKIIDGFQRICFGFPMGILLYRIHKDLKSVGDKLFLLLLLLGIALLSLKPNLYSYQFYLISFILIFPALILLGTNVTPPKILLPSVKFLGQISYPLYVLHLPLIWGIRFFIFKLFKLDTASYDGATIWLGVLIIPVVIMLSYYSLKIYDEPLRKFLNKKIIKAKQ